MTSDEMRQQAKTEKENGRIEFAVILNELADLRDDVDRLLNPKIPSGKVLDLTTHPIRNLP